MRKSAFVESKSAPVPGMERTEETQPAFSAAGLLMAGGLFGLMPRVSPREYTGGGCSHQAVCLSQSHQAVCLSQSQGWLLTQP